MLVERVYPNFIDLLSEIGGILKILVFLCIAVGFAHNQILFDKYILESVFSSEEQSKNQAQNELSEKNDSAQEGDGIISHEPFTYFELISLKYCFRKKGDK